MSGLAASFRATYRGANVTEGVDGPLDAALTDLAERGREAWPTVALEAHTLARYLGERAPAGEAPVAWLGALRAGDLFLACACAEGLPRALAAFDAAFLAKVGAYLGGLRPTPEIVADTQQELREKLFVDAPGRPPKIRQYTGQGALGGWVRVAAVRTALNLLERERAGKPRLDETDDLARAIVPDGDPELELVRARYKDAFAAAFREALQSLSPRDRSLLRFTFVERLTPARIGAMYGVHRTSAMRWIDAARDDVLARTRARMMERLGISTTECDSVIALVRSRVDVTLTSLLKTA